ncbi:MAG: hypothetical protein FWD53_09685, partial [Phycisphaerales bacterium]|nr:hypothetical protein [Phycisphaerales bacterium]
FACYAYQPEGKDNRITLQPSHTVNALHSMNGLTGDGAYWFAQNDKENTTVSRYDGQKIQTIAKIPATVQFYLTPGNNGIIHHNLPKKLYSLISQQHAFTENSLEELIAKHPAEVAQAFTGPRPIENYISSHATHVQADTNGNVWLFQREHQKYSLKAFSNGKWLDAADALKKAGCPDGKVDCLFPLGKTTKILATKHFSRDDPDSKQTKTTFILSIRNKIIHAEPINGITISTGNVIYSPNGEPWLDLATTNRKNALFTQDGIAQTIDSFVRAVSPDGSLITEDYYVKNQRLNSSFKHLQNDSPPTTTQLPTLPTNSIPVFLDSDTFCISTDMGLQLISLKNLDSPITFHLNVPYHTGTAIRSPLAFAAVHNNNTLLFFPLK